MMHIETLQMRRLDEQDFNRVVKLDARNWWNVLSREYGVEQIHNFHARMEIVFGRELVRLLHRCEEFPEGQIVIFCHELKRPVGAISSLILKAPTLADIPPTWHGATGNGYFYTHDPRGDTLICPSIIALHTGLPAQSISELKKQHISTALLHAQHGLAQRLGLPKMVAYSRPMNYGEYTAKYGPLPIEEYLQVRDEKGRLYDRSIGMHERELENFARGLGKPARILPNGRPLDPQSLGHNVLMDYSPTLASHR
ncbi:MAG: hypothetical protein HY922_04685 [Elusimicrobia bacterium]|nr:hypothetical protein [Elusimicrobiota bacterium]